MKAAYINFSYFAFASKLSLPFPFLTPLILFTQQKLYFLLIQNFPLWLLKLLPHLLSSPLSIVKSPVVTKISCQSAAFSIDGCESSLLFTQMFSIFNKKMWISGRLHLRGQIFMCLQAELWLQRSLWFLLAMFSENSALNHPHLVWILHQVV